VQFWNTNLLSLLLRPTKEECHIFTSVCVSLSVCLSVCPSARSLKNLWTDFDEISWEVGESGPRNNRSDSGGDPDPDPDPGLLDSCSLNFLKGFFIYYCNSYRQPKIKLEDPWRRFGSLSAFCYYYYYFFQYSRYCHWSSHFYNVLPWRPGAYLGYKKSSNLAKNHTYKCLWKFKTKECDLQRILKKNLQQTST